MSTQKYLNGLQSIQRILTEFEHVLERDQHKEDYLSYYKPDYIFRGVSTYKHEQSESKKDLLRIRSGAAVRLSNSSLCTIYCIYKGFNIMGKKQIPEKLWR